MSYTPWRVQDLWKGRAGNPNAAMSRPKMSLSGRGGGLRHICFLIIFFASFTLWGIVGVPSACQTDLRGEKQKKKKKKIIIIGPPPKKKNRGGGPRPIPPPWIRHWYQSRTKQMRMYVKSRLAVFDGRFLRTHNIQLQQVSALFRIVRGENTPNKSL